MKLVMDTNVLVAAFRSRQGASNLLLRHIFEGRLTPLCSTALFLEYESVLSRPATRTATGHGLGEVRTIMDAIASMAEPVELSFRMRPMLKDASDEMVLETAFNGGGAMILTHDVRDFEAAKVFGIEVVRPGALLRKLSDD